MAFLHPEHALILWGMQSLRWIFSSLSQCLTVHHSSDRLMEDSDQGSVYYQLYGHGQIAISP